MWGFFSETLNEYPPHLPQCLVSFHVLTFWAKDWVKATKPAKLTAEGKGNVTEPYSALKAGNIVDNIKAQRFRKDAVTSVHLGMNCTWSYALQQRVEMEIANYKAVLGANRVEVSSILIAFRW